MKYRFNNFVLDAETHELRRNDDVIGLEPQVYDLLLLFLQNPNRVISKEELIDEVWGGRIVSDATLSSRVKVLRQAVGDDGTVQSTLKTVRGVGFRFVADVEIDASDGDGEAAPVAEEPVAQSEESRFVWPSFEEVLDQIKERKRLFGSALLVALSAVVAAFFLWPSPKNFGAETIRLAVLPVINNTGDPELDWIHDGIPNHVSTKVEEMTGYSVAAQDNINALTNSDSAGISADLELSGAFFNKLRDITGVSHVIAARVERTEGGKLRLFYRFHGPYEKSDLKLIEGDMPIDMSEELVLETIDQLPQSPEYGDRISKRLSNSSFKTKFLNLENVNSLDKQYFVRAGVYLLQGDKDQARKFLQLILENRNKRGIAPDDPSNWYVHLGIAEARFYQGETDQAIAQTEGLLKRAEARKNLTQKLSALSTLGNMFGMQGDLGKSREQLEAAAVIATKLDRGKDIAKAYFQIGQVHARAREYGQAELFFNKALITFQEAGVKPIPPQIYNDLGGIFGHQGQTDEAEKYLRQAREGFHVLGDRRNETTAIESLGRNAENRGDYSRSEILMAQSLKIREDIDDPVGFTTSYHSYTILRLAQGNYKGAVAMTNKAKEYAELIGSRYFQAEAHGFRSEAEMMKGNWAVALEQSERAAQLYEVIGNVTGQSLEGSRQELIKANAGQAYNSASVKQRQVEARRTKNMRAELFALNALYEIALIENDFELADENLSLILDVVKDKDVLAVKTTTFARRGLLQLKKGRLADAKVYLSQAKQDGPVNAHVLLLESLIEDAENNADEARTLFAQSKKNAGDKWALIQRNFGSLFPASYPTGA